MKVGWIYLAIVSLTIRQCFGAENSSSSSTLTSCPLGYGLEGVYEITLPDLHTFSVLCNAQIAGAGHLVVASRSSDELNFYRNWQSYKKGFGDLSGDFFIGLDKLHAITQFQPYELYIHLEDFDGNTRFARYDEFYIEDESEFYKLSKLGNFTGDAKNSFYTLDQPFSTYDKDNDADTTRNCAKDYSGAWWYNSCTESNLFGAYYEGEYDSSLGNTGMTWELWRGPYYSYKLMKILIRTKCTC